MKKFTLMIVAALMVVTASAQKLDRAKLENPVPNKVRIEAHSMPVKAKPVKPFKLNKKAHKAAPVSSIDDLTGKWLQIYYSYADEAYLSPTIEIARVEGSDNKITITGWWFTGTEPIEATVDLTAGTVTINPQIIYDGNGLLIELVNADADTEGAALVGTIDEDGSISFEDVWAALAGEEPYEYGESTMLVRPNGKMNYVNDKNIYSDDVYIEQGEDGEVYVFNFGDYGRMIELQLNEDQTVSVPSNQVVTTSSSHGDYFLYGIDGNYLVSLTATGTETEITFDQPWTGYTDDSYWLGSNDACTVTLTDGSTFVYPVEPEDVAATPASPTDLVYEITKYGPRILFEIPRKDVDGNKLRKDRLFYQIYYMIGDKEYAYTLKASDYEELESDMDIIPYDFTDDFDIFTDPRRVYLYGTLGWDKVGVKSIYTGGGETHESEIIWFDIAAAGISQVNATQQNSGKAYNLAGQQVKQGYKGIVIKDGKKFMMK